VSLIKLHQQLAKLSQDLVEAKHNEDWEEAERLEDELENLREEIDAIEMDEYDSKHGGHGWR
jgi:hypothetical protein